MELNNSVYCAARDGELDELKRSLDHKPREEVVQLVSLQTNGATPLVIACQNGHLDVVLYLIRECEADVEQVCSVIVDGEKIEDAPPLWLAAEAGHLSIVKTLVKHQTSVNSTTKTSSTPLRAACFHGHIEIAKYLVQHGADIEIANKHGSTCLMITCYKGHYEIAEMLIQNGANVNRKCSKGHTALHGCADSGCLEILKLLLEHGAEYTCDSDANTPLLSAAVSGHANIVEYFIEVFDCPKEEKINALELLSAACMDKNQDIKALAYWKRAMNMRYEDSEFPQEKSTAHSPIASCIDAVEVRNFEQLEDLMSDPVEARVQALLIRERILGPGHPDTHYSLRIVGAVFGENSHYNKCIHLWIYDLEVQQGIQEPLSSTIEHILSSFVNLFSAVMVSQDLHFSTEISAALFKDIFRVFKSALKEIENAIKSFETRSQDLTDCSHFRSTLVISLHLIGLMCKLQPHLNKTEELELKRAVYKLVLMDPKTRSGWSLLHLACNEESSTIGHDYYESLIYFPSPEVVDLLLEGGAYPNAMDLRGSTFLYIIAKNACLPSGNTPLLSAAVSGLASIVEYFIEDFDCSKEEKINALELLGAKCMDEKQDMIMALAYWKRAMNMRYEDSEFPLEKSTTHSRVASCIDAVEVHNVEQLEDLISDPVEARVQALLIRERILGPGHPDTHHSLAMVGVVFAINNNYNKCIQLSLYDLDVQQGIQEPLSLIIEHNLSSFVDLFSAAMMSQDLHFSTENSAALFKDIFSVFKSTLKEIENAIKSSETRSQDLTDCSNFHRILVISLHLISLVCKLQPYLNKTEELELKRTVYKLVLMDPRTRTGCSLLHLACNEESSTVGHNPLISFPSPEVVDLLLEVGACPNVMDLSGSTPLHVIAKKSCLLSVFETLLNYGAHLDFRNSEGKTAIDIDQNRPLFGVYPLHYINLQCLSAQVVRSRKIPYKGLVHKSLETFVDKH